MKGYAELFAALEAGNSQLVLRGFRELWDQKECLESNVEALEIRVKTLNAVHDRQCKRQQSLEAEVGDLKAERDRYRECLKQVHGLLVLETNDNVTTTYVNTRYDLKRLIDGVMGTDN